MSEKILVFTKNWFGDVIMQTPCFRILKENFPGSRLYLAMPARIQAVVKDNPFVDHVIAFDEKGPERNFFSKLGFVAHLVRERFTRVYLLHRSRTRAGLCRLAQIPARTGYDVKGRKAFLTQAITPSREILHQTDEAVYLLKASGLRVPEEYFCEFYFSDAEALRAERWIEELIPAGAEKIVALNPGANWKPKRWPVEFFAQAADLLAEKGRIAFIITGSGEDIPLAQEIISKAQKAAPVSFCGKTSVGDLGALLTHCDVMITGDSGPMHIASAVGTPVCALFGPTHSAHTGPRGKGPALILEETGDGNATSETLMAALTPEKVVGSIRELGWV
ncbi:MAG: lipopolysaccharide heptosyltransferase II [Candidatus Omnitrophica bacterium]|nr:lipopolysaccharide heptosyltransferase II [Candidatus Omnitrophota bacterium]